MTDGLKTERRNNVNKEFYIQKIRQAPSFAELNELDDQVELDMDLTEYDVFSIRREMYEKQRAFIEEGSR